MRAYIEHGERLREQGDGGRLAEQPEERSRCACVDGETRFDVRASRELGPRCLGQGKVKFSECVEVQIDSGVGQAAQSIDAKEDLADLVSFASHREGLDLQWG